MLEFCSGFLPLVALGCFVWGAVWCAAGILRPARAPAQARKGFPLRLGRPALFCLGVGLGVQLFFLVWCLARQGGGLGQALEAQFYGNTDARHYIDLAQYGYGQGETFPEQYLMIVFFPLFPGLLRLLNLFGWLDYRVLALAVQLPLFCAAGIGLFALTCRSYDRRTAWWALVFLVVSPASFFFLAPMTESLFLALCVWYGYCLQRRYWGRAALLGILAGLSRAPGGLLTGMALLALLQDWRRNARLPSLPAVAAMLGPGAGLGIYFGLNQLVYGRWDQYSVYQWEHWNQRLGLFTETIRYHLHYLGQWWSTDRPAAVWICLTAVLCILAAFGLLAAAARHLPASWLGYGLAYLLLTMGTTWLISAPRYAIGLFCLPVAAAVLLRGRPRTRGCLAAVLLVCNAVYMAAYLTHQPVY